MGNDWIIDVLADLRSFAHKNELPLLAAQLNDATLVAQAEISQMTLEAPMPVRGETAETRSLFVQVGEG
ncbi:MAG: hypothetical protein OSA52_01380 [Yoonia sp.]|jgi:hypothetical protein|nr:hypothetical protein [Yoonia sp.]